MTEGHIERLNAALEGRYHIERELGQGGMATVLLADDLTIAASFEPGGEFAPETPVEFGGGVGDAGWTGAPETATPFEITSDDRRLLMGVPPE